MANIVDTDQTASLSQSVCYKPIVTLQFKERGISIDNCEFVKKVQMKWQTVDSDQTAPVLLWSALFAKAYLFENLKE